MADARGMNLHSVRLVPSRAVDFPMILPKSI
jgi:hypothetical protein